LWYMKGHIWQMSVFCFCSRAVRPVMCVCTGEPQSHHGAGHGHRDPSRPLVAAVYYGALQNHHKVQNCLSHFPDACLSCSLYGKSTLLHPVVGPKIITIALNGKQPCLSIGPYISLVLLSAVTPTDDITSHICFSLLAQVPFTVKFGLRETVI
jgi:hypothetical protein